jgi:hypothetical protein
MLERIEIGQLTQSIEQFVSNFQTEPATDKVETDTSLLTSIQKLASPLVEALNKANADINDKFMQQEPNFDEFLEDTLPLLETFNNFLNMHLGNKADEIVDKDALIKQIQTYAQTYKDKDSGSWNRLKATAVLLADTLFAILMFILVLIVMTIILVPLTFCAGACMESMGPILREASNLLQWVFEAFNDWVKGHVSLSTQDSLWDLTIHGHSAIPMSAINIASHANRFFSGIKAQPDPVVDEFGLQQEFV